MKLTQMHEILDDRSGKIVQVLFPLNRMFKTVSQNFSDIGNVSDTLIFNF